MTSDVVRQFPVKVVRDNSRSLSKIFNLGTRESNSEIIVWINDDVKANPDWLENLLTSLETDDTIAAVGGPTIAMRTQAIQGLLASENRYHLLGLASAIYRIVVAENKVLGIGTISKSGAYGIGGSLETSRKLGMPVFVDMLSITNLAIKKKVLQEIGGFDEGFHFTHIDGDLFIRIRNAGYKLVFSPEAWVLHYVNPTGATRNAFHVSRDHAYFLMKHFRPKNADAFMRTALNLTFFVCYWMYVSTKTRTPAVFSSIHGLARGFTEYLGAN
jgi:GT2 family glycosyltransferase